MTLRTALVIATLATQIGAGGQPSAAPQRDTGGAGAGALTPVVVELFTAEGCSSCPPADALLQKLLDAQPVSGAEIVGLGEHVDYWNELGWKDRFSSAALTNRQRVYAARLGGNGLYTPQMVVDGRSELVGSDARAARLALDRALNARHGAVRLSLDPGDRRSDHVAVDVTTSDLPAPGRGDHADILVAVTEDHLQSDVTRGENHGRVLKHAAVVRYLITIGEASTDSSRSAHADIPLAADWQRDYLKIIALVQERRGRAILASAVAPLARR